jgi:hypothetical protein
MSTITFLLHAALYVAPHTEHHYHFYIHTSLDDGRSTLTQPSVGKALVRVLGLVVCVAMCLTGNTARTPKDTAAIFKTLSTFLSRNVVLFAHVHTVPNGKDQDIKEQSNAQKVDKGANEAND